MNASSKPIDNVSPRMASSTVNVEVVIEEDNKEDHNDEMFVEIVNAT